MGESCRSSTNRATAASPSGAPDARGVSLPKRAARTQRNELSVPSEVLRSGCSVIFRFTEFCLPKFHRFAKCLKNFLDMLGNLYGIKQDLSVVVRADVHLELHAGHPQHLRTFLTGRPERRPPRPLHSEACCIARSGKLDRARSRLYRSRILQENMRWKALAEIYTMHSFAPL